MIAGCIGTPSDVSSQSEPRICTSCLSFTAGEIPASNFLARRAARRRAHHNHRFANLCTASMAAAVGAEHRRCRVFGKHQASRTATACGVANNFFRTRKSSCRFYIFFLPSPSPSVLVFLFFFILPSPPPIPPLPPSCLLYMPASSASSSLFPSLQQDHYIKSYANISSAIIPDKN